MSFREQLRSVFSDEELDVLSMIVEEEAIGAILSMTSHNKRVVKSIRDKLSGQQRISNRQTTPPDRL